MSDSRNLLIEDARFLTITQELSEAIYSLPYDPLKPRAAKVQRPYHSHVHGASTTYGLTLLLEFLRKAAPSIADKIETEIFADPELFQLFRLAIFCHDMANTSEKFHDENAQAELYTKEMLKRSLNPEKIQTMATVLREKENKNNTSIFRILLQSLDCLEINRCFYYASNFDISKMSLLAYLKNHCSETEFPLVFDKLVQYADDYFYLLFYLNNAKADGDIKNRSVRTVCARAPNAYQTTKEWMTKFSQWVPPIKMHEILDENKEDTVLNRDFYLIRHLVNRKGPAIHNELEVLKSNVAAQFKEERFTKQEIFDAFNRPALFPGFQFRPMSLLERDYPVESYAEGSAGLILDERFVLATHFYKHRIGSVDIGTSKFTSFERPQGAKLLTSLKALREKTREIDRRRCGLEYDNYDRHYGAASQFYKEILGTYDADAATIGIITANNIQAARDAIITYHTLHKRTGKTYGFYRQSASRNLERVSVEEVFWWAQGNRDELKYTKKLGLPNQTPVKTHNYKIEDIENITCSLAQYAPSAEHPVSYSFSLKSKDAKGVAYVEKGVRTLTIDDEKFHDARGLLYEIASQHHTNGIKACNALLENLEEIFISKLGIADLHFSISNVNKKQSLNLNFQNVSGQPDTWAILQFIGYNIKIWKFDEFLKNNRTQHYLRLPVFQALDAIFKRLTQISQDYMHDEETIAEEKVSKATLMNALSPLDKNAITSQLLAPSIGHALKSLSTLEWCRLSHTLIMNKKFEIAERLFLLNTHQVHNYYSKKQLDEVFCALIEARRYRLTERILLENIKIPLEVSSTKNLNQFSKYIQSPELAKKIIDTYYAILTDITLAALLLHLADNSDGAESKHYEDMPLLTRHSVSTSVIRGVLDVYCKVDLNCSDSINLLFKLTVNNIERGREHLFASSSSFFLPAAEKELATALEDKTALQRFIKSHPKFY